MPRGWGLSKVGFKAKDFQAIKEELEADIRKEVDPTLHFGPGSVAGIMTAIVTNQARQLWAAAQGPYHSLQPNSATGKALDALCSLTGTYHFTVRDIRLVLSAPKIRFRQLKQGKILDLSFTQYSSRTWPPKIQNFWNF